jgi:acyl-CoA dehydrogenase
MSIDFFLTEEHHLFRETVREFMKQHSEPHFAKWEKEGKVDRQFFKEAATIGILGLTVKEEYGGYGLDDVYSLVMIEEAMRQNMHGPVLSIIAHSYLAMNYLTKAASEFIRQKYLVPSVSGEIVGALGMTEPGAGSDLAALRTTATKDGDFYVLNGSKTFITNGVYADFVVMAAKTNPSAGVKGISLFVVDTNSVGYTATKLDKLGVKSSDTAEIGMDNVKVPLQNLIGEEGKGFYYMMESLQTERLSVGWYCIGACLGVMDITIDYLKQREAFGKPISKIQVIRHRMAELQTEIESLRAFVYLSTVRHAKGESVVKEASMIKYKTSDLLKTVTDDCLQFFGGYGFIEEYAIARLYRDQRVNPIYAGTNEIMKEIISKIMLDDVAYNKVYKE